MIEDEGVGVLAEGRGSSRVVVEEKRSRVMCVEEEQREEVRMSGADPMATPEVPLCRRTSRYWLGPRMFLELTAYLKDLAGSSSVFLSLLSKEDLSDPTWMA